MLVARLTLLLAVCLGSLPARAQDFPNRQITVVVPFTPGAGNDLIGRHLAEGLAKRWNVPVIVENRPGAGSATGTAYVARSKPDGYTLLFVSGSLTSNPAVQDVPYDTAKDLIPVAPAASGQYMLAVGPSVKATNLKEFIEEAKSRRMLFGTAGVGSAPHFAAELFNDKAGLQMTAVPYKGGNEALVDLIGGRVDAYFAAKVQIVPAIEAKQIRGLAILSSTRATELADVPTTSQAGVQGAEFESWYGVFVPAGTPAAIVSQLNAAVNEVMSTPSAREFLARNGAQPYPMKTEEFSALVNRELGDWKKLAEKTGMRAK
jgi:tripartite-type tricarboxylate transporter receptor subunit TctC